MPRRLLILCEFPTLLGGERSMLSTLGAVTEAGYRIVIAAPPLGDLAKLLRECDIDSLPLYLRGPSDKNLSQQQRRERLSDLIRTARPNLIHANSLAMSRLVGPVAAEMATPSIGHLRDIINLSAKAIDDLNCNRRLLAVSRETRDHHVGRGLDAQRTRVLYNGVDLDRFQPSEMTGYLHSELGIPIDRPLIVNIGQICLRKAQNLVVEVAHRLIDRESVSAWNPPHFLLVGERQGNKEETRQLESSLKEAAGSGPTAGRIHMLGTRGDVDRILGETTILLHTARQEPLGRVLLEASAAGVVMVATDVGGTCEILSADSDLTGIIVPKDDVQAMTDAIDRLLRSPEERTSLGLAARNRAEQVFDIRKAGPNLVSHYDQVLDESNL